ncbi:MAG: hypothetical protein M1812_008590, partial [Candelaria pacifica]
MPSRESKDNKDADNKDTEKPSEKSEENKDTKPYSEKESCNINEEQEHRDEKGKGKRRIDEGVELEADDKKDPESEPQPESE